MACKKKLNTDCAVFSDGYFYYYESIEDALRETVHDSEQGLEIFKVSLKPLGRYKIGPVKIASKKKAK